jgi:flagella basal body P-ring formation protein FlgA
MAITPLFSQSSSIQIELRPKVEVLFSSVTLGLVAEVHGQDDVTCERLKALRIGRAPAAGESVRVDRATLQRWIRARLGVDPRRIAWSGSDACNIQTATQSLSGDMVAKFAKDELTAHLVKTGLKTDIQRVSPPNSLTLPAGRVSLKIREMPVRTAKRQTVLVEVSVDDQFVRVLPVVFEVKTFAPALVALRNLKAGEELNARNVAARESECPDRPLLPVQSVLSVESSEPAQAMRLRRPLAVGDPLTTSHVEAMPLVKHGSAATLITSLGSINVESRVEVLEDGALGQKVRVKLSNASGAIQALVTGPGCVEVIP